MDKVQVRYTPDEAELIAAALEADELEIPFAAEMRELAAQAARLRHLAARARVRARGNPPA